MYGKKRTHLGLSKVKNMYKLSSYYYAQAKKELPYYSIGKSTEEIHEILVNEYLNPDEELLELVDDLPNYYNNVKEEVIIDEEDELEIDNILNLDAFVDSLEEIIEDIQNSLKKTGNTGQILLNR